jgi:trans-aconitate 2-methyltransferase
MSDWDPEHYNRFRQYRAEPVEMIFARLAREGRLGAPTLSPTAPSTRRRIIDLGCGTGENTVELARRAGDACVIGLDSSPAMLRRANELRVRLEAELRARVEFRLGDLRDFEAEREYSIIFSNAALHWVANHRAVLAACFRALTPGGTLVIQVPANDHETAQATIAALANEAPWRDFMAGATPPSRSVASPSHYSTMLAQIGFEAIDCHYHTFEHPMRSPTEIVEWCRATALRGFLERLPAEYHHGFLTALTQRLEAGYGTRGPLVFTFRRLFIWAQRPER